MKKLLIILFMLVSYLGTSQKIIEMYPIDTPAALDTIMSIKYIYDSGDTVRTQIDTLVLADLTVWLEGWESWGQARHNKWTEYQLRDSLFTDSIQALILKYVP